MEKIDCKSLSLEELQAYIANAGFPKFRGKQVFGWLLKGITDFKLMTNIPKDLITYLDENFYIPRAKTLEIFRSKLDETVKFLFELSDGELIESVLMKYKHGWSQCISTQVGCKMGCTFCATGMDGFSRNLLPAEMISQIEEAQRECGVHVSSVVLMGMGEPLDNLDNVLRFFEMVQSSETVSMGGRKLTISTCGLVDKIYLLAEKKLPITLSVSLHAPNDEIRRKTMPVARRWPIEQLIKACGDYAEATGRRVSFEYAMINGVNDSDDCARELASRLKGLLCHVNLIPLNEVENDCGEAAVSAGFSKTQSDGAGSDSSKKVRLSASGANRIRSFYNILEKNKIPVSVRRTLGSDIDASCGQLRRRRFEK